MTQHRGVHLEITDSRPRHTKGMCAQHITQSSDLFSGPQLGPPSPRDTEGESPDLPRERERFRRKMCLAGFELKSSGLRPSK